MSEYPMYPLTEEEKEEINNLANEIMNLFNRRKVSSFLTITTLERLIASAILGMALTGKVPFEQCLDVVDRVVPINIRTHMLSMQEEFEKTLKNRNSM